ncbi:aromatic acid exporter family protein [Agromyces sp. MMS24-JH15]|uniref:FUSC family protein n=1 Tax=Agromyces sp. MMS24-JH15 TaxID=3243765 RepID=UPI003748F96D
MTFATDRAAVGGRRVLHSIPAIVQITVTAVAAYAIAHFGLGHAQPLIAAIVAISALGFVRDARPVRVLETVVAMTLGIALAEVLLIVFGAGLVQYAVALALTLAVARFLTGNAAFAIAAAVQCSLVMLMPAPDGGPFVRTLDALVGGATALLATALVPRDPLRTARREGRRLLDEHVAVLGLLAESMRSGDALQAGRALERARATGPLVDAWRDAVESGTAIARVSPFLGRARFDLARQRDMVASLDLATRNLRVVARRAEWLLHDGGARPALADLDERIAVGIGFLADSLREVGSVTIARASFAEVLRHLDPERMLPQGPAADRVAAHAVRPYLVDLLTATGMPIDEARALLP